MIHNLRIGPFWVAMVAAVLGLGCADSRATYPDPGIRIENLKRTVEFLTRIDPPRKYVHADSLKKSADYIAQRLLAYGLTPERQTFAADGTTYENVIASVGPKAGARMIVGAHYDVYDDMSGADDNASAIAGLLEIARFAQNHAAALPLRVDFVAYTLEEPPFFDSTDMGSYVHARFLHDNNINVRGMICLEMIGYFTDRDNSQRYPLALMRLLYPSTGNYIAVVSNFDSGSLKKQVARCLEATSVPVEILSAPAWITGVDFSDHRNYWKFGYEAVMVTDTAFYRNANYHKATDTMDTLDFDKMAEVVKGVCWALLSIK